MGGHFADSRDPATLLGPLFLISGALTVVVLPLVRLLGESIGPSESHGTSGVHAVGQRLAVLIDIEGMPKVVESNDTTRPAASTAPLTSESIAGA